MRAEEATRFFDTSACLNLSRPTSGVPTGTTRPRKRPGSSSMHTRGQMKIDLYNFDHIDFIDSKYVLTSPRSLEACSRLNIKPATLLPKRLADVQDDIGSEKVRLATLADVRDQLEIERLAKLQLCREEREKIIREEALNQPMSMSTRLSEPQPSILHDRSQPRRIFMSTKFNPSDSLLDGLNQPTTISSVAARSHSASAVKFSDYESNAHLPPRSTGASSILKSTGNRWAPPTSSTSYYHDDEPNNQYDLRASSSMSFGDDVRRMNKSLQRISTSDSGPKRHKDTRYMNGLENVKEMIERRAPQSAAAIDPESATFEKKQYEILLGHFDHELKIQKAQKNARQTEKEKEVERYESLLHDFEDQSLAEERRQSELRRKINKLHHSRQLYETLQAKNYEQQLTDIQRRRAELLGEIKRKDRRTKHFVKDKEEAVNLSRTLAKSSQDLREYLRESNANFHEMAQKAELTSSVLVPRSKASRSRRHLQSSLRT